MNPLRAGTRSRRPVLLGVIALALLTALAMTLGTAADAKKKKKGPSVFQQTIQPNSAIPDAPSAAGPSTPVNSTITVGKKFKGKTVGDLNVTGITTTGNTTNAARDLRMRLIAPNGRAVRLIGNAIGNQSIGPLTLDDDTPVSICDQTTPPCAYAPESLNRPFAGTANMQFMSAAGTAPLSHLNGLAMRGTWTLQVWDQGSGGNRTSVLNAWGLKITAEKPVK